jgi:hypothetical protein
MSFKESAQTTSASWAFLKCCYLDIEWGVHDQAALFGLLTGMPRKYLSKLICVV